MGITTWQLPGLELELWDFGGMSPGSAGLSLGTMQILLLIG